MKFFSLLICLYILYLVSLPCKDGISCGNDLCTEQASHHNHPEDQDHADGCSPFCICACCSVTVVLTTFNFESIPAITPVEVNFLLKENHPIKALQVIWEPPKTAIEVFA